MEIKREYQSVGGAQEEGWQKPKFDLKFILKDVLSPLVTFAVCLLALTAFPAGSTMSWIAIVLVWLLLLEPICGFMGWIDSPYSYKKLRDMWRQ